MRHLVRLVHALLDLGTVVGLTPPPPTSFQPPLLPVRGAGELGKWMFEVRILSAAGGGNSLSIGFDVPFEADGGDARTPALDDAGGEDTPRNVDVDRRRQPQAWHDGASVDSAHSKPG